MWTREEAFCVIEKLEPALSAIGAHVALGGSVAYRGTSDKDLDLIIYPHTVVENMKFDWLPVKELLKSFFRAESYTECQCGSQLRDWKQVSCLTTPKGKRVDFFFLE